MAANEVEEIKIPDGAGKILEVKRYKGRLWPFFAMEAIKGLETFQSRHDDAMVLTYPKSGTHWVYEIVRLLIKEKTDVQVDEKENGMIENALPETLEAMRSPRALNTHAHFELMPRDVLNKNDCKLVYVTRDPRDVAVSFFNHHRHFGYEGQWKDYLQLFLTGQVDYESWFDYTCGWEQGMRDNPDLQVHVTSYEAFHENTREEIEKLAQFLGASTDEEFLTDIINKTSIDSMRAKSLKTVPSEDTKLSGAPIMFRKGKVGDWKNWFTVAQSEQFDAIFEQKMTGTKAHALYSNRRNISGSKVD